MGKRFDPNDGLHTVHRKAREAPAYIPSLPDIAQGLRAKELYEKREDKQPSVPTLPDIANRLNEPSTSERVLSHMHRHRRHYH